MSKLRTILFHRVGITAAAILLQIVLYVVLIWRFSAYAVQAMTLFICISLLAVLRIVNEIGRAHV